MSMIVGAFLFGAAIGGCIAAGIVAGYYEKVSDSEICAMEEKILSMTS